MGRLNDGSEGSGQRRDLQPGETRTIHAKDKNGDIIKTIIVVRSAREYVFDLCDAYNNAMTESDRARGLQWFVDPTGALKLGDHPDWSRHNAKQNERRLESERARHLRLQFEPRV